MLSDEGDDAAVVDAAEAVVKFETPVVFHAAVVYGAWALLTQLGTSATWYVD